MSLSNNILILLVKGRRIFTSLILSSLKYSSAKRSSSWTHYPAPVSSTLTAASSLLGVIKQTLKFFEKIKKICYNIIMKDIITAIFKLDNKFFL